MLINIYYDNGKLYLNDTAMTENEIIKFILDNNIENISVCDLFENLFLTDKDVKMLIEILLPDERIYYNMTDINKVIKYEPYELLSNLGEYFNFESDYFYLEDGKIYSIDLDNIMEDYINCGAFDKCKNMIISNPKYALGEIFKLSNKVIV